MTYSLRNIRVLIVDTNQPIRSLLRNLLLDLGIGMVDVAAFPAQGWDLHCQFKHDLVFIDWPAIDGEEALDLVRRIRRDPASPAPHVPVLMMTGYSNEDRVFQARDAGITEFLIKPFTVTSLVRYITHIVENPRSFVLAPEFTGPDRRRRGLDPVAERRGKKKEKSS